MLYGLEIKIQVARDCIADDWHDYNAINRKDLQRRQTCLVACHPMALYTYKIIRLYKHVALLCDAAVFSRPFAMQLCITWLLSYCVVCLSSVIHVHWDKTAEARIVHVFIKK